jgi:hypothetical protein
MNHEERSSESSGVNYHLSNGAALPIASSTSKRSCFRSCGTAKERITLRQPFVSDRGRAVEMTTDGKPGKPKAGFPSFPPSLEIAARFPHSHSSEDRWTYKSTPNSTHTVPAIVSSTSIAIFPDGLASLIREKSESSRGTIFRSQG